MILERNPIAPSVGMPCCMGYYTDRLPCTITQVVNNRTIEVKRNEYKTINHFGEEYEIGDVIQEDIPTKFTKRKDGRWVRSGESIKGISLALNTHSMRIDPSF